MPYVVSLVVVALIWKVMLIDKVGFINRMLDQWRTGKFDVAGGILYLRAGV
jgi:ABC-type sugar transport system permease subunit